MATSGIGAIKNIENGRLFAFKSTNLEELWEIYHNQLDLNIHHNKSLQRDWGSLGSEKFVFYVIEEIDDEFLLDDEFVDYVSRLDNNYNDFNISSYSFEYSGETTLIALYNIIGREECSPEFLDKLKSNDLSIDYYDEIKNEMISLIDLGYISKDEIESKLNELLQEKSHQIRVFNLDMQYKLMNDLEDIIGINELKNDFKAKLKENDLPEFAGFTIQENIMELIFSNKVLENNIEKQIDSCIEILKEKVSHEMIEKLLVKADNLENDAEFINRLNDSKLSINTGSKIINQLKEFIKLGIINEDNFSQKLDELIDIEIENQWIETKKELLSYLSDVISSDALKVKLDSLNLDISLLAKIDETVCNSIESRDITSKEDIDKTIVKICDEETERINKLKEELLSYLANTYGTQEEQTSSFKTILNISQLSIEDGKEFINQLSKEISSFKLKSIEAIKNRLEELIFDRNKSLLLNTLYDLVGKEKNNDTFSKKLQLNYLTGSDGDRIRSDLVNLIDGANNLDDVLEMRNTLEHRLDDMLETRGKLNYNMLIGLSNELINSLNEIVGDKQINDSFKEKLYSHNLGEEYWNLIKDEITQVINGEFIEPDFESRMKNLNDLKSKGIDVLVDETIQKESAVRSEEYKQLKSDLMSQLNDLIGIEDNTPYYEELLFENHLSNHASLNIRNDFNEIIVSDEVYDADNFNYKYEELLFVKNKTIKTILMELVQKQKNIYKKQLEDIRLGLLDELYSIIGDNLVLESFTKRLYSNQLSLDYAETFKNDMENFINSDEVFDEQFRFKLDELIYLKEKGVDFKLTELIEKESQIKRDELNNLKKELIMELNNLTGDIKFIEKLKTNNLSSKIGAGIIDEIVTLIDSPNVIDSKFNYKLEELASLNEKSIASKLDELIEKESLIYDENITNVRSVLHGHLDSIIGKTKINVEFKEKLHENLLHESFAAEIKNQLSDFIDSDEIFNKKYEFKLDELNEIAYEGIESRINEIIDNNRTLKEKELKEVRKKLNDELISLIGETNNDYYDNLLKANNLNSKTGFKIREELLDLINLDNIDENSFEFKLDELVALNELGLDKKLSQIIEVKSQEYNENLSKTRTILIEELNNLCESSSFKNKLHINKLQYSYKDDFKKEVTDLICSDQPLDEQFEVKLDELLYLKEKSIDIHLNELIKREADIKNNELIDIRKELDDSLNDLIGHNENNDYYTNLLKSHNLNQETGNAIRAEIYHLINSEEVFDDKYEFKLDELIVLKENGLKNHLMELVEREENNYNKTLKSTRTKLLASLKLIISKNSFKEMLYSKQIDDSFIDYIDNKLSDFINSDSPYEDYFEVKLDELLFTEKNGIMINIIDELVESEAEVRQKEFDELTVELNDELYSIIGKDKNSIEFTNKLTSNNLNDEIMEKIRFEIIDLISSDKCQDSKFSYKLAELKYLKEYSVENKLDDIIKREAEIYDESLKEKREHLIDLINSIIGKNRINISFQHKLNSQGLEEDFGNMIRCELIEFINSDRVFNNDFKVKLDELTDFEDKGIESKIDEMIEEELHKRTLLLKEELLNELYCITGEIPLSEKFLLKLSNADFDEEFGIGIVNHFKSEIDSLNIEEGFDFDKAIDDMIYDESKDILLKQTYEIVGRTSDSEYFTNKLKNNMIPAKMGGDIKSELFSMFEGADLETLTNLRKTSMQIKFDEIIEREYESRTNKLSQLREKLLEELNKRVSGASFKNELRYKNLSIDYLDKIKSEMEHFIKSDVIVGDFEFKIDELIDLDKKGVNSQITEIMERESNRINIKFEAIKDSLLTDLEKYNYSSTNSKMELNKRNLNESTGKLAYDELKDLITSNTIKNSKFTSKYDELKDLKATTVRNKFIEIIEEYSIKQQDLIKFLHEKTIEDKSLIRKLNNMNLHDDFIEDWVNNIENKIKNNEYTQQSEITQAIDHYVNEEAVEQNKALTKLYDIVGKNGLSFKFRAKLTFKGLSSSDGKKIVQKVENKIKKLGLRADKVSLEIDTQIKEETMRKKGSINVSMATSSSNQRYVFCTNCGHKNINGANFCEECGEKLTKL